MNKEIINQYCEQIRNEDGHTMSFGSLQTLKLIEDSVDTLIKQAVKKEKEEEKTNYILIDGHIGDRIKMNYNEVISAFMNIEQDVKIGCRKGTEFLSIARVIRDSKRSK